MQENDKKPSSGQSAEKVSDKLKVSKLKKPDVITSKRKAEDVEEKPRKRLRPLLQRETSLETTSNCITSGHNDVSNRTDANRSFPVYRADCFRLLPSLKVEKTAIYNFNYGLFKATITVSNFIASMGVGNGVHKV